MDLYLFSLLDPNPHRMRILEIFSLNTVLQILLRWIQIRIKKPLNPNPQKKFADAHSSLATEKQGLAIDQSTVVHEQKQPLG